MDVGIADHLAEAGAQMTPAVGADAVGGSVGHVGHAVPDVIAGLLHVVPDVVADVVQVILETVAGRIGAGCTVVLDTVVLAPGIAADDGIILIAAVSCAGVVGNAVIGVVAAGGGLILAAAGRKGEDQHQGGQQKCRTSSHWVFLLPRG